MAVRFALILARIPTLMAVVALLALGAAQAQRLTAVLPRDTVFALGSEGLSQHSGKLDPLVEEAERLDLGEAFRQLFGDAEEDLELSEELPAALAEVRPLELLGQEAWLTVSISSYNPLPAITVVARTAGEATAQIAEAIREAAVDPGVEREMEGSETIYLYPVEGEENPFPVLAVSQAGDVAVLSTNPDVLRGVLRRLAGADDPGFSSSESYRATLGELGRGNLYAFLDYGRLAGALEPLGTATAASAGLELLIARVLTGLASVGSTASVVRIEEDGLSSESIRVPGVGDPALAALLAPDEPASREPLRFVPADALAVNVSQLDLQGWWDYLGELAASSDELGNPDLDELVLQFTGMDLRASLFDWMGTQVGSITMGLGTVVQPGVPSENLLGESVYLLETRDEAAADQGLSLLFGMVSGLAAGFSDPMGQGGSETIRRRDVAGVRVTSYAMAPGVTIAHAVVDGWVLLATSDSTIDAVLRGRREATGLEGELLRLATLVPPAATAFALADLGETISQSGAQLAAQAQMFAGLGGGEIDFDALQRATEAVQSFFSFLAERAGGSVSYTLTEGGGAIRSFGHSEFSW
jgi:hypothetical protein